MWVLILLLLIGDVVVGYCWWQERRAHTRSRRALGFWRDYRRGGDRPGYPVSVPLRLLDSDHGMAAVREVLQAKVAEHRADRGAAR